MRGPGRIEDLQSVRLELDGYDAVRIAAYIAETIQFMCA